MALEFLHRDTAAQARKAARVAVFPGAWNPPTIAHVAIARAALGWADEVVWVVPRAFPHKPFDAAGFRDRSELITLVARAQPGFSAAASQGGLYAEIADEARAFFGEETAIGLACGRDAAERIANWDYGMPGVFAGLMRRNNLLVAARAGQYTAPAGHEDRVVSLTLDCPVDEVSSTELRRLITEGKPWEHLAPEPIIAKIRTLYGIK
jgi:nicotinic acid mononucleotide adenylyltransferase